MFSFLFDRLSTAKEFETALTVDECVDRLKVAMDARFGNFRGKADVGGFRLRRRIGYRNSFQTIAIGVFFTGTTGTRLVCRFGPRPAVLKFFAVWLAFVTLFCLGNFIAVVSSLTIGRPGLDFSKPDTLMFVAIPFGVLAGGVLMAAGALWATRNEVRFLMEVVVRNLEARLVKF